MEDKKLQEEAAINLTMPVSPTARMLNMKLAPTQSIEESREKYKQEMIKKKKEERRQHAKERLRVKSSLAATKIQSLFRGNRVRNHIEQRKEEHTEINSNEVSATSPAGIMIVQIFRCEKLEIVDAEDSYFVKIALDNDVELTGEAFGPNPEWNVEAIFEILVASELPSKSIELQLFRKSGQMTHVLGSHKVFLQDILQAKKKKAYIPLTLNEDDADVRGMLVANIQYESGKGFDDDDQPILENVTDSSDISEKTSEMQIDDMEDAWPEVLQNIPKGGWKNIENIDETTTELQDNGSLLLMVVTWNLQAHKPPADLSAFLQPGKFHMYAIGTEECVNTIAKSVIFRSKKEWEDRLKACLGSEYVLVCSHGLQAIHNAVFVHERLLPLVNRVNSSAIATGLGNQMGNKGGVGIALNINSTSFLFVSCHFEAHQGRSAKRNANFHKIDRDLHLHPCDDKYTGSSSLFDRVFWAGDFNYRINGTRTMIDRLIQRKMHRVLLANDQLSIEKGHGEVFEGFSEGPLHFLPTYKYDRGTDDYDTSVKQRIPSWTDRILYKSNESKSVITQLVYDCYADIKTSDHRPVYSICKVPFKPSTARASEAATINQTRSEVCSIQ